MCTTVPAPFPAHPSLFGDGGDSHTAPVRFSFGHHLAAATSDAEPAPPKDHALEPSPAPSNPDTQHSESVDESVPKGKVKYDLRPEPRNSKNVSFRSTWYDNDQSGTYDPSVERKLFLSQRKRPKKVSKGKKPVQPQVHEVQQPYFSKVTGQLKNAPLGEEMEDAEGHIGRSTTLRTALSHPVVFNYEGGICDWCRNPNLGIGGLGERDVEVIEWYNGLGYTEMIGGAERDSSRMCSTCTWQRMQILVCEGHKMQELEDAIYDEDALFAQYDRLTSGKALPTDKWCAVCPMVAHYGCRAAQEEQPSEQGEGTAEAEGTGCGLLLCEACATDLMEEHNGNLKTFLAAMETDESEMGLRADCGFLDPEWVLMKNVLTEFQ